MKVPLAFSRMAARQGGLTWLHNVESVLIGSALASTDTPPTRLSLLVGMYKTCFDESGRTHDSATWIDGWAIDLALESLDVEAVECGSEMMSPTRLQRLVGNSIQSCINTLRQPIYGPVAVKSQPVLQFDIDPRPDR